MPSNFPLPVPRGWQPDGVVTTESDGSLGWIGNFRFTEDVRSAADRYEQELQKMGLEVDKRVMDDGENVDVLMGVTGTINGKPYSGILTFSQDQGENVMAILFGENPDAAQ